MRNMEEHRMQCEFVKWCRLMAKYFKDYRFAMIYAIPNAGHRSPAMGNIMKREGLRKGCPDLCLPVRTKKYGALYIEMKTLTGRLTIAQEEWLENLRTYGNRAEIARSPKEAAIITADYLSVTLDWK